MKYTFKTWFIGKFFYLSAKPYLKQKNVSSAALKSMKKEYNEIVLRAKNVSQGNLVSSYLMGIFFIAMNRSTGLSAEENYDVIAKAVSASKLFKKGLGSAEDYVSEKKFPKRKKWAEESRRLRNENNWVVDVLPKCADFDYGMDYHECGICKVCKTEGCPELAKYMCRLDYIIADMLGVRLVRNTTIAEGYDICDFRYSLK